MKWLVWSVHHSAWWGPERAGYYTHVDNAGRYDEDEALRLCRQRTPELDIPAELPVREDHALALRGLWERFGEEQA